MSAIIACLLTLTSGLSAALCRSCCLIYVGHHRMLIDTNVPPFKHACVPKYSPTITQNLGPKLRPPTQAPGSRCAPQPPSPQARPRNSKALFPSPASPRSPARPSGACQPRRRLHNGLSRVNSAQARLPHRVTCRRTTTRSLRRVPLTKVV